MGRNVSVGAVLGRVGVSLGVGVALLGPGGNDQRWDGLGEEGTDGLANSHSSADNVFASRVDALACLLCTVDDALASNLGAGDNTVASNDKGRTNRADNVTLGLGLIGLGRSVVLGCLGGRGRCGGRAEEREAPALGLGRLLTVGRRAAGPILGGGATGMGGRMSRRGAAGRLRRRYKGKAGKGQRFCTVLGGFS